MAPQVVLITGAGQRLGAETARRLMDEGFFVLIHVRSSREPAQILLAEAEQRNGRICGEILQADLTDDQDVEDLITSVSTHGHVVAEGLFGLVHNASFYSQAGFE